MPDRSVTHATFTIERSLAAHAGRVFAALADPAKKRRWFAEGEGFEVLEFAGDFRVGGAERARFRPRNGQSPIGDVTFRNDTVYLDIVENRRVLLAYTMAVGDQRISASLATFELVPGLGAPGPRTQLVFTEQAAFFEGADGPALREAGWRKLVDALAKEVESADAAATGQSN